MTQTASTAREQNRLILQIERDRLSEAGLRTLLASASAVTSGHREELRILKARVARARRASQRRSR